MTKPPRLRVLTSAPKGGWTGPSASGPAAPGDPLATRLYALAPRAVGTVETESLTSFVRALATEHVVSPSALLRVEVFEPHKLAVGQKHLAIAPVLCTESINGAYRTTEVLVRALERLTGSVVQPSTMLGRDHAVCFDGALRHVRAWCPQCLEGNDPYDRLQWAFTDVTSCQRHALRLVDRCGSRTCGRQHRPWHHRASAAACPFCGTPLSRGARIKAPVADSSEVIVRDLLALLLTGVPLTRDAISAGLVSALAATSWAQLSASSGVSIATMCGIRRKSIRPQLDVLVNLIGASGEDVSEFLGHAPTAITTRKLPKPTKGPGPRGKKLAYTPPVLEQALRDALALPDGQIPSAKAFARAHKTTLDTLRRRWPLLAVALGRAFRAQEHARRTRREAKEIEMLRTAFDAARRDGDPTKRTVIKILGRPGWFLQKHIQLAYAEMIGEDRKGDRRAA